MKNATRAPLKRIRRLPTYESGRVCTLDTCTTILSISNKAELCYLHQPKKLPRIRGMTPGGKLYMPIIESVS